MQRGIHPRKIFLVGFSQGAALSLMVGLTTLHDLGGIGSLSGWIPHRIRDVGVVARTYSSYCGLTFNSSTSSKTHLTYPSSGALVTRILKSHLDTR